MSDQELWDVGVATKLGPYECSINTGVAGSQCDWYVQSTKLVNYLEAGIPRGTGCVKDPGEF